MYVCTSSARLLDHAKKPTLACKYELLSSCGGDVGGGRGAAVLY